MKKANIKTVIIGIICVALVVAAVLVLLKYKGIPNNEQTAVPTESTSAVTTSAQITPSESETVPPSEDGSESTSGSEDETGTKRTILNTSLDGAYEPTEFEAKLFNAINSKRKEAGVDELNWNDSLHTLAKVRADEVASIWSHTRPNGNPPTSVLVENKLEFSLFSECLAKGTNENEEGVKLLLTGFLKEGNQSAIVLSPDYRYASVAVSTDSAGKVCAVILFCNP